LVRYRTKSSPRWHAVAFATLAAAWPAGRAISQSAPPAPPARLLGVFDQNTGEPVIGVQVRDEFSGTYALTTATGTVRLSFLSFRGNAAAVRLTKIGYEPKTVLLAQADTAPLTEVLERVPMLAPMVTTERYRLDRDEGRWDGFSRRCEQRTVTCFTESTLAAKPSSNMADFLIDAPGVTIGACGPDKTRNGQCGRLSMHSATIPPAYCEPSIFIDGFLWNPHMTSPIDMQPEAPPSAPFTPANVKGVEVYPSEVPRPIRFEGDPICGAIVIWTK
jgi:hypothetical protein